MFKFFKLEKCIMIVKAKLHVSVGRKATDL